MIIIRKPLWDIINNYGMSKSLKSHGPVNLSSLSWTSQVVWPCLFSFAEICPLTSGIRHFCKVMLNYLIFVLLQTDLILVSFFGCWYNSFRVSALISCLLLYFSLSFLCSFIFIFLTVNVKFLPFTNQSVSVLDLWFFPTLSLYIPLC